jgi:predicted ester cyclase
LIIMSSSNIFVLAAALVMACFASGTARSEELLPQPGNIHVASALSEREAQELLIPARRYYAFWNTGDERYAQAALADNFADLNLPEGRPQGPQGPLIASRVFRKAVPDLMLSVPEAWVIGDQVLTRLKFKGHFTGEFAGHRGDGRDIRFDAIDLYTIRDGRILANWHLEDNLTLLKQLGVVGSQ